MKAIVVHQYGGPEVLKFEDYPDPVPGLGEVLVRVAATSVNPIDYKRRAGLTKDFYPLQFPGLILETRQLMRDHSLIGPSHSRRDVFRATYKGPQFVLSILDLSCHPR
jgi:hypothetical protein